MKAQSISINLVGGCNATCPFCISKLTWNPQIHNNYKIKKNLPKALSYAKYHGVDTILITGKGEPTACKDLTIDEILKINQNVTKIPIVELQTNGSLLNIDKLRNWVNYLGLTTIAISICSYSPVKSAEIMGIAPFSYYELIENIRKINLDIMVRISLNLIENEVKDLLNYGLYNWVADLKGSGVHQLTLRELGIPNECSQYNIVKWIEENKISQESLQMLRDEIVHECNLLRRLPFGANIYDFHGLSTCITTCLTDSSNEDEIRSLILQADGHVYHSWNFTGSILL